MAGCLDSQRGPDDGSVQYRTGSLLSACGGVRAAAEKLRLDQIGVGKSMLARYADVHAGPLAPGKRKPVIPVDIALALERHAARPVVTEWLAAQQGYTLFRPAWAAVEAINYPEFHSRLALQAMQAVTRAALVLEDGVVERGEAVAWREDVRGLMKLCAQLDCALTTQIGADADP